VAFAEKRGDGLNSWRSRYQRPDGTYASQPGFVSEKAAVDWGNEQEALIRRSLWIDPRDGQTLFGEFVEDWLAAVGPRLADGTVAKYRSHFDNQLLPQWETWPLIGIFNSYIEIEKWVSELHEDYAESTVSSIFATFSTLLNVAVRARMIPANPCYGLRVTSGEYELERLVASPVQVLRAAMRLYRSGLGLGGFTLCLMDAYTGARWSELVGQQIEEYDEINKAIAIRAPLKEVNGKLTKHGVGLDEPPPPVVSRRQRPSRGPGRRGRPKTPAGTRWVNLPPSIATFYESLLRSHKYRFVFCTPEGAAWRRSNFRQRYWRPAWDGLHADDPTAEDHEPAILPWFTFHEGRHTHATWLTEDGIPEVARRWRLGQKMKGIARTYDHVTPVMKQQIADALEARWRSSLDLLAGHEQRELRDWFTHLGDLGDHAERGSQDGKTKIVSQISPIHD
jgi:integrase